MAFTRRRIGGTGASPRIHRAVREWAEPLERRCLLSAGDLDTTFGVGGKVITDLQSAIARHAVVVRADGKIVAVGETTNFGGTDFAVAQFNPDGTPDVSFGNGGTVTTDLSLNDSARGVAVQADGKVVVVGYTMAGSAEQFTVVRYNTNGSLDNSFSDDGIAVAPFGPDAMANAITILPNGKILVAGAVSNVPPTVGGGSDVALARFNPDGTLDSSFGTGGLVAAFPAGMTNTAFAANAVAVHTSDGKIAVAGMADSQLMVARFGPNGAVDPTFNSTGWYLGAPGRLFSVVQSGSDLVFGGYINVPAANGGQNVAVGRIAASGSPVLLIGTDLGSTAGELATGIALDSNGRIFASAMGGPANTAHVLRYNANGSLDGTFSGGGIAQLTGTANAVAVDSGDRVVVAGTDGGDFRLARFQTGGSLDPTFSGDGIATNSFLGSRNDEGRRITAQQPDGKLIVVGSTTGSVSGNSDVAIARYNVDGSLDQTFGNNGYVITDFGAAETANAVAIQVDGKIVVVGQRNDGSLALFLAARYNANGALDAGFGVFGSITTSFGAGANNAALAVAIQPGDGKIIAVGRALGTSPSEDFAVVRYNPNGTLDTTFGSGGQTKVSFGSGADNASSVVLHNGSIVIGGTTSSDFALAQLTSSGSLDSNFGTSGRVITPVGSGADSIHSLALQADGKIVAAGEAVVMGTGTVFALVRYLANGSLDTSFGLGGTVATDLTGTGTSTVDIARGVAIQSDGKIVVAGSTGGNFAVARYNVGGGMDATFGSGGVVITDFGSNSDAANGLVIQSDGKIVAAGTTLQSAANGNFALARYLAVNTNTPPTAVAGGAYGVAEGGSVGLSAAGSSDPDETSSTLSYAWDLDGDNVFGETGVGAANGDETGPSPTFSAANLDGPASLVAKLRVTDSAGASGEATAVVNVANLAPAVGAITAPLAPQLIGAAVNASASFSDAGTFDTHTAVWDWGDSTTSAGGVSGGNGAGTAIGTHAYAAPGVYTVTLTVTDDDGASTQSFFQYVVINVPPTAVASGPYVVAEGGTVGLSAAGSSDPDQSAATLTYAWDLDGDNVFGETGLSAANGDETGDSPMFSAAGLDGPTSVNVRLRVTDSIGAWDEATAIVQVANVTPTAGSVNAPVAPQLIGAAVNASASFSDAGTFDTHTAVWDWGDATTSAGVVVEANGAGTVTGSHAYAAAGVYTVTLTVTDDDGASAQSVFQYVVVNAPPTAVVSGPYAAAEGGSVALSAAGSSDPEQDASTLTYAWDLDNDGIFGETGVGAARGDETGPSPTFSAANLEGPSSVNVALRVTDAVGAVGLATAVVNVTNVAPTVGAVAAPLDPQLIGATVNVSASFADAGKLDAHTAVWNWGDNTTSSGTVAQASGAGTVTGSHAYAAAGVYTVTLTVTDDDGAATQSVFQYVVVYNPAGGFVTGGGTIDSPAGALVSNPTARGIAQFAFVSKYLPGANVPTGETRFRFNVGDFVFESVSYDWLVVSGAKARYRGTGTVNGTGNYGFQVTMIDGQQAGGGGTDRFRIKIWNRSNGNAVVYDNQVGAADDADPGAGTALRGGSIRIEIGL